MAETSQQTTKVSFIFKKQITITINSFLPKGTFINIVKVLMYYDRSLQVFCNVFIIYQSLQCNFQGLECVHFVWVQVLFFSIDGNDFLHQCFTTSIIFYDYKIRICSILQNNVGKIFLEIKTKKLYIYTNYWLLVVKRD